jgi:hypothetical protein
VCKSLSEPRIQAHGPAPVGRYHHGASARATASAKRSVAQSPLKRGDWQPAITTQTLRPGRSVFLWHKSANLGRGGSSAAFTMSVYAHSQDDALKAAASSFSRVVTTRDTETGPQG